MNINNNCIEKTDEDDSTYACALPDINETINNDYFDTGILILNTSSEKGIRFMQRVENKMYICELSNIYAA